MSRDVEDWLVLTAFVPYVVMTTWLGFWLNNSPGSQNERLLMTALLALVTLWVAIPIYRIINRPTHKPGRENKTKL